ncbi:glycoside hydrolase family 13 protein [Effusibacillus consociatus]|uniref:Glycoside hydrolase family 13 protein n=1 Tax=Effusibacillus consociatus TaxID=1117041 RepID=A0ABV9Q601_9BACL
MIQEAIFHVPYGAYAYSLSPHHARITLRAKRGDLKACYLVHSDRYEVPDIYETVRLSFSGSDELFDYFQATIESKTRRIRYRFLLDDGVKRLWYGEQGFASDLESSGCFQLAYLCTRDLYSVPEWVNDTVVYQIFPDRFWNGDPANDPEDVCEWGELPTAATFFGGDLQGIIDRLPYLEKLGVNLIYMTPIFLSPSTHKYDTTDYFSMDPMFGDMDTIKSLVKEAHARGIRVMLDAVFNHCGADFAPFRDVVEKGAKSRYVDWFHLREVPVDMKKINYETFANGVATMPKLRTENPEVKKYLLQVAEFWVKEVGIDGWRLDVANEVDHAFWREFREVVRAANPEALIIGEVWHDSSPWLQGDQFDGVMNYLFREAVVEFFAKRTIDAEAFDSRLTKTRMMYKEQANRAMFNLLGSHDTARFLTVCGEQEERMRLAVTFQMTYVGMPEIYYGDEVGMTGETDPDCRRTMIWDEEKQNKDMLKLHQDLIAIRKQHSALQTGSYRTVIKDPLTNLYGFVRENGQESIFVVLNNSPRSQKAAIPGGASGTDLLTGKKHSGELVLKPYGAKILLLQ